MIIVVLWLNIHSFFYYDPTNDKSALAEQATGHQLNQWWHSLLTHMCVTRPRWVDVDVTHGIVFCLIVISIWCITLRYYAIWPKDRRSTINLLNPRMIALTQNRLGADYWLGTRSGFTPNLRNINPCWSIMDNLKYYERSRNGVSRYA